MSDDEMGADDGDEDEGVSGTDSEQSYLFNRDDADTDVDLNEDFMSGAYNKKSTTVGSNINSVKIQSTKHSNDISRSGSRSLKISNSASQSINKHPSLSDFQLHIPTLIVSEGSQPSPEPSTSQQKEAVENTDPLSSRLKENGTKTSAETAPSTLFTKLMHSRTDSPSSQPPQSKSKTEESDSGIFSTLLSAAHNAASHLIPKSALKSSEINDSADHSDLPFSLNGNSTSAAPIDTLNHTSSFLNHLDFLLSTTPNNELMLKKTPTLDTLNLNSSERSSISHHHISSSPVPTDEEDSSGADERDSVGTYIEKVKFKSVKKDEHPAISTFGKGNLTLDAIDKHAETSSIERQSSILSHPNANQEKKNFSTSQLSLPNPNKIEENANLEDSTLQVERSRKSTSKRPDILRDITIRSLSPAINSKLIKAPIRNSISGRLVTRGNSLSKPSDHQQQINPLNRLSTSDIPAAKDSDSLDLQDIEYASPKRNAEFHSVFKDSIVSPTERLIADFSCALSKDLLIQGRLYISDKHLCFYSNILGWVKTSIVPFKEIVQIEQKNTAMLFPNAISIQTLHEKYLFASFISRDTTFDLIMDIWNQTIINKQSVGNRGTIGSTDFTNDDTLMYDSDTSSVDYQEEMGDFGSSSSDVYDDSDDINPDDMTSGSEDESSETYGPTRQNSMKNGSPYGGVPGMGPSKHEPTSADYDPGNNEREMGTAVLHASLGKVINVIYGNDTSFAERILKAQGNYDISPLNGLLQSKKREYVYTKPISGSIGPSKTRCEITETLDNFNLEKYVKVTQSSKTPDIPSGNSFVVKTIYLFSWAENNNTKLQVYTYVDWSSKSWIKAAVEKGTFDGIKSSTVTYIDEVEDILQELKSKPSNNSQIKKTAEEAVSSLPSLGPKEHPPTTCSFTKGNGYEVLDDKINLKATVGTVFQLLCGDDTSYAKRILERQKNIEISEIPKFQDKTRKYDYVKPLSGPIGPKQTKCLIEERIESDDVETCMVLEQISKTPDVPSGNSFEIHTKFYLYWGEKNSTNMLVATSIEWKGKSWIKAAIEKGSISGQKASVQDMVAELKDIISSSSTVKRRPTTSKKKTDRSRPKRKSVSKQTITSSDDKTSMTMQILDSLRDLTVSVYGVILIGFIITVFVIPRLYHSIFEKNDSAYFVKPNTIQINGRQYHVVPSLDTLYDNYKGKSEGGKAENLVLDSEYDIWNWIEKHSDTDNNDRVKKKHKGNAHKDQDLREVIRLTELKLERLKQKAQRSGRDLV